MAGGLASQALGAASTCPGEQLAEQGARCLALPSHALHDPTSGHGRPHSGVQARKKELGAEASQARKTASGTAR